MSKHEELKNIAREISEVGFRIAGEMDENQLRFHVQDIAKECSGIKESLQEIANMLGGFVDDYLERR